MSLSIPERFTAQLFFARLDQPISDKELDEADGKSIQEKLSSCVDKKSKLYDEEIVTVTNDIQANDEVIASKELEKELLEARINKVCIGKWFTGVMCALSAVAIIASAAAVAPTWIIIASAVALLASGIGFFILRSLDDSKKMQQLDIDLYNKKISVASDLKNTLEIIKENKLIIQSMKDFEFLKFISNAVDCFNKSCNKMIRYRISQLTERRAELEPRFKEMVQFDDKPITYDELISHHSPLLDRGLTERFRSSIIDSIHYINALCNQCISSKSSKTKDPYLDLIDVYNNKKAHLDMFDENYESEREEPLKGYPAYRSMLNTLSDHDGNVKALLEGGQNHGQLRPSINKPQNFLPASCSSGSNASSCSS